MTVALKIVDQAPGTRPRAVRELRLASERITLRELLQRRIDDEVAELNAGREQVQPLVTPTEQESRLNGRQAIRRAVDAKLQLEAAVEAFRRNRIVVIVGERQVADLDEEIVIAPDTEVTFLKLVPLVGG